MDFNRVEHETNLMALAVHVIEYDERYSAMVDSDGTLDEQDMEEGKLLLRAMKEASPKLAKRMLELELEAQCLRATIIKCRARLSSGDVDGAKEAVGGMALDKCRQYAKDTIA